MAYRISRIPKKEYTVRLFGGPLDGMYVYSDEPFGGDKLELRGWLSVFDDKVPLTMVYKYTDVQGDQVSVATWESTGGRH